MKLWHAWCLGQGVHPLAIERSHIDAWVRYLRSTPQPRTVKVAPPATIARRLSCLSKFYEYAVRDVELLRRTTSTPHPAYAMAALMRRQENSSP